MFQTKIHFATFNRDTQGATFNSITNGPTYLAVVRLVTPCIEFSKEKNMTLTAGPGRKSETAFKRTTSNKAIAQCLLAPLVAILATTASPVVANETLELKKPAATATCNGNVSLHNLRHRIIAIADRRERSTVRNCASIRLGVKACGGPKRYLVYSKSSTDIDKLKKLVKRYNRCDQERNVRLGLISTCEYRLKPRLRLQRGECAPRRN